MLENLLMSLNSFAKNVAPGCRVQLCGFGESQMKAFTNMWEKASTDKIKVVTREFHIENLHLFSRGTSSLIYSGALYFK